MTTLRSRRPGGKPESHRAQFQGTWLPRHLLELFWAGRISPRAVLLLSTIKALEDPERGCYASDEYLADKIAVTRRETVNREIGRLVKAGLLRVTGSTSGRGLWVVQDSQLVTVKSQELVTVKSHNKPKTPTESLSTLSDRRFAGADGAGGETMTGLFPAEQTKSSPADPAPEDFGYAEELQAACKASGVHVRRFNRKKSAAEFNRLRREVDPDRIRKALDWYAGNIKSRYAPQAYCGESFRRKFAQIERAAERGEAALRDKAGKSDIHPAARAVVERLELIGWKGGVPANLPAAVDESWRQMSTFAARLRALAPRHGDRRPVFASALLSVGGLNDPAQFVERHFAKLAKWWTAKTLKPITITSEAFNEWGRTFAGSAKNWGDERAWAKLMKEVGP